MNAMVACSALLSVLLAAAGPNDTTTRFRCYPIRPGDSAAQIAERLTGHHLNRWGSSFQIFDANRRLVRKSDYDVIYPGWTACLAEGRFAGAIQSAPPAAAVYAQRLDAPGSDLEPILYDPVLWWLISIVLAAAATSLLMMQSWKRQRALAHVMRRFGGDFVREFGRPSAQYRGAGPLPRARLRINPRRSRMEILVAPSPGRTYPNLSDHRSNVEYDVARVTAALKQEAFAGGRPYAEGEWVVLPFHFKGRVPKEGDR